MLRCSSLSAKEHTFSHIFSLIYYMYLHYKELWDGQVCLLFIHIIHIKKYLFINTFIYSKILSITHWISWGTGKLYTYFQSLSWIELKCVLFLCSSTIIRLMSSSTFKHVSKCLNHYLSISKWSKVSRLTIGFLTSCSVKFFFNLVCSAKSWYVVRGTDCKESKHILYSRECVTG